jgi:hypothetical protein
MARRYTLTVDYPLAGSDTGAPVRITFNYTPGRPARWYLRNGDPGYPAEPAEIDLHTVWLVEGAVPARIQQAIWNWAAAWLETDGGREAALNAVDAADERAAEFAAELRRDA